MRTANTNRADYFLGRSVVKTELDYTESASIQWRAEHSSLPPAKEGAFGIACAFRSLRDP
jgi:hypothetical protein